MPKLKITPERALSNRNHHLTFWDDAYKEVQTDMVHDLIRLKKLITRLVQRHSSMKAIDCNRRENAVSMGVSIRESDEKYSFEELIKAIPEYIAYMKKTHKEMGMNYEDLIEEDKII